MPENNQNPAQVFGGVITDNSAGAIDHPTVKRVDSIERAVWVIITVLVVSTITLLIAVATLIIDSFHFNSATYQEYSNKLEANEVLLETNQNALKENQLNQEMIIELLRERSASTTNN